MKILKTKELGEVLPNTLILGDCLEVIKSIPAQSIDLILTDPPYGTTNCSWDSVIPFESMWKQLKRIIKPNGAILLMGVQPFTSALIMSNPKMFKYLWVWEKSKGSNFVHARNMPLKVHEDVLVFSNGKIGHLNQLGNRRLPYNPQGVQACDKAWIRKNWHTTQDGHTIKRKNHSTARQIKEEGFPKDILKISQENHNIHPTQKPVALMEYMIKTYTQEGETVLDFTMGSGTTGIAAVNLSRNFIGIERDREYFELSTQRIRAALIQKGSHKEASQIAVPKEGAIEKSFLFELFEE